MAKVKKDTIGIAIEVTKSDRMKLKRLCLEAEEAGAKTTLSKVASKIFREAMIKIV